MYDQYKIERIATAKAILVGACRDMLQCGIEANELAELLYKEHRAWDAVWDEATNEPASPIVIPVEPTKQSDPCLKSPTLQHSEGYGLGGLCIHCGASEDVPF